MREDLTKKIDEILDSFPKDLRHKAEELLSLQKQADIVPAEVSVPVEDVVMRFKISDGIEMIRCRTCIVFRRTNMTLVVRPTMAEDGGSLYSMLKWFCDYQSGDEKDEELDTYCSIIVNMLSLPVDLFYDIPLSIDIAGYIFRKQKETYEAMLNELERHETEEDIVKNEEFENAVKLAEQFNNAVKELSEKAK